MAAFDGQTFKAVSYTHEHSKTKDTLAGVKPIIDEAIGFSGSKQWAKNQAASRKEMKLFCDNCLKEEDKKEGKMSVCTKCKAIGREVRYCSKVRGPFYLFSEYFVTSMGQECQRAAWKGHKRECGKALGL